MSFLVFCLLIWVSISFCFCDVVQTCLRRTAIFQVPNPPSAGIKSMRHYACFGFWKQGITMNLRLFLNSQSSCLCLLSAEIAGILHHIQS